MRSFPKCSFSVLAFEKTRIPGIGDRIKKSAAPANFKKLAALSPDASNISLWLSDVRAAVTAATVRMYTCCYRRVIGSAERRLYICICAQCSIYTCLIYRLFLSQFPRVSRVCASAVSDHTVYPRYWRAQWYTKKKKKINTRLSFYKHVNILYIHSFVLYIICWSLFRHADNLISRRQLYKQRETRRSI